MSVRTTAARACTHVSAAFDDLRARQLQSPVTQTARSLLFRIVVLVAAVIGGRLLWDGLDAVRVGALLVALGAALYVESHTLEFEDDDEGLVVDSSDVIYAAIIATLSPSELVIAVPVLAVFVGLSRGTAWDKTLLWTAFTLGFAGGAVGVVTVLRAATDLAPVADLLVATVAIFAWFRACEMLFLTVDQLLMRRADRDGPLRTLLFRSYRASLAHLLSMTRSDLPAALLVNLASMVAWWAYALVVAQHRLSWLATTQASRLATVMTESRTDPLTGLLNRRAIRDQLDRLPNGADGVLLMVDLDHFKQINDVHGHEVGDEALRRVARHLQELSALRPRMTAARWGGEEFLVLVRREDEAWAVGLAEEIRQRTRRSLEQWNSSASVGVASLVAGEPFGHALARADTALYQAKAGGRDRVVVWEQAHSTDAIGRPGRPERRAA